MKYFQFVLNNYLDFIHTDFIKENTNRIYHKPSNKIYPSVTIR